MNRPTLRARGHRPHLRSQHAGVDRAATDRVHLPPAATTVPVATASDQPYLTPTPAPTPAPAASAGTSGGFWDGILAQFAAGWNPSAQYQPYVSAGLAPGSAYSSHYGDTSLQGISGDTLHTLGFEQRTPTGDNNNTVYWVGPQSLQNPAWGPPVKPDGYLAGNSYR